MLNNPGHRILAGHFLRTYAAYSSHGTGRPTRFISATGNRIAMVVAIGGASCTAPVASAYELYSEADYSF
jgi:hypothetical protein